MITDTIARVKLILEANFAADMKALADALAAPNIKTTATVHVRKNAALFVTGRNPSLPGIGVYPLGVVTQAKRLGQLRESTVRVALDYYARGADPEALALQAELAAEALLQTIDKLPGDTLGLVIGAGEEPNSVSVEIAPTVQMEGERAYETQTLVTVPITEQDTGL